MKKILGIDVGGTKIATILVDPEKDFKIIGKKKSDTEADKDKSVIIQNIFDSIDGILNEEGISGKDLSGIGIALPGPIDRAKGISIECANLNGWVNVGIRDLLEERYNTHITVENDARAAAAGEAAFGAGKGMDDFLYICLSTGIGCGVIIGGKLYRGADGAAGELSHILFSEKKELYELASGKALQNIFSISAENLKELYETGDETAVKAFDHLVHYLGIGIGNAVTLFNPEAVVIGGGLSNLGGFLLGPLEREIRENAFSVSGKNVKIKTALNQNDAGAIGIASLVLNLQ